MASTTSLSTSTSRVDRLLSLLDTGPSTHVRSTAAKQLGEIVKLKNDELFPLLAKVSPLVLSKNWDTRIASSWAIEQIVSQAGPWPKPKSSSSESASKQGSTGRSSHPSSQCWNESILTDMDSFDLFNIIQSGIELLSSAGTEYELETTPLTGGGHSSDNDSMTAKERLTWQRQNIKKSLGTSLPGLVGDYTDGTNEFIKDEDLLPLVGAASKSDIKRKSTLVGSQIPKKYKGMERDSGQAALMERLHELADDIKVPPPITLWPYQKVFSYFAMLMTEPSWTLRHGATIGLNYLLRSVLKRTPISSINSEVLSDYSHLKGLLFKLALKCIQLLAVDRFADYVGESAIFPVRESTASLLGLLCKADSALCLQVDLVVDTILPNLMCLASGFRWSKIPIKTVTDASFKISWQARHGGYLGMYHILSSNVLFLESSLENPMLNLMEPLVDILLEGLGDPDDDIKLVSAQILLNILDQYPNYPHKIGKVMGQLWAILEELDEINQSTAIIMQLLCTLYEKGIPTCSSPKATMNEFKENLSICQMVEKLFPFMRHPLSQTRAAVIKTLISLLSLTSNEQREEIWDEVFFSNTMRLIFQNLLIEDDKNILDLSQKLYHSFIAYVQRCYTHENIVKSFENVFHTLIAILMNPPTCPYDPKLFYFPSGKSVESTTDLGFKSSDMALLNENQQENDIYGEQVYKENGRLLNKWVAARIMGQYLAMYTVHILDLVPSKNLISEDDEWRKSFHWYDSVIRLYILNAPFGYHRQASSWILIAFLDESVKINSAYFAKFIQLLYGDIYSCLELMSSNNGILYGESRHIVSILLRYCLTSSWLSLLSCPTEKKVWESLFQAPTIFCDSNLSHDSFYKQIVEHADYVREFVNGRLHSGASEFNDISNRMQNLADGLEEYKITNEGVHMRTLASLSCVFVSLSVRGRKISPLVVLPNKLNPVIRPLVNGIRFENWRTSLIPDVVLSRKEIPLDNRFMRDMTALAISRLILILSIERNGEDGPQLKIVQNLIQLLSHRNTSNRFELKAISVEEMQSDFDWIWSIGWPPSMMSFLLEEQNGLKTSMLKPSIPDWASNEETFAVEEPAVLFLKSSSLQKLFPVFRNLVYVFYDKMNGDDLPDLFSAIPLIWDNYLDRIIVKVALQEADVKVEDILCSLKLLWLLVSASLSVNGNLSTLTNKLDSLWTVLITEKLLSHPAACIRFWVVRVVTSLLLRISTKDISERPDLQLNPKFCLFLFSNILPSLSSAHSPVKFRQGIMELFYSVIQQFAGNLNFALLPYLPFAVVPVMSRMADSNDAIRLLAAKSFSLLIQYLPLEQSIQDPTEWPDEMKSQRKREKKFIEGLIKPSTIEPYILPIVFGTKDGPPSSLQLRPYQQDGINWLAFLNRYGLHGILCDDMGLGKTLQTLSMIASDHHQSSAETPMESKILVSLIICPSSLLGHWIEETKKYVGKYLSPKMYSGNLEFRQSLIEECKQGHCRFNLLIGSYDLVRNDIDRLSTFEFNYVVLDEGHAIRNPKAKTTIALKMLQGAKRLILSGTPVQNTVIELWSLFDWLMPGYLGTFAQFMKQYGRPIVSSRQSSVGNITQDAANKIKGSSTLSTLSTNKSVRQRALVALEALHQQTLPFLLRRLKDEVLKDLPPKIIQDYYCSLSPLQKYLYEEYVKWSVRQIQKEKSSTDVFNLNEIENDEMTGYSEQEEKDRRDRNSRTQKEPFHHIFKVIQILRKICNHPSLVLDDPTFPITKSKILDHIKMHPHHYRFKSSTSSSNPQKMDDICLDIVASGKLLALRQLLKDLDIGGCNEQEESKNLPNLYSTSLDTPVPEKEVPIDSMTHSSSLMEIGHRVLIFSQGKAMLDFVEQMVLRPYFPSISFLRLDGSVNPLDRTQIVTAFNSDPSIHVLLLTTSVGGLGLNLTSADTVIFLEADWNPSRDLQAMDRAHRLGQTRSVSVYRLITQATIEEKCLSLQKFKLDVNKAIITQQNMTLNAMSTEQVVKLFSVTDEEGAELPEEQSEVENEEEQDIDGT